MNTEIVEVKAPRVSLVAKMADRFNVEPAKLMGTLKATAFKSDKPVSDEQMMALLIVADQYSLNPFTKEIFAFPDKGGIVPVVSVDGWARIINEHPMYDGMGFVYGDDGSGLGCTCTIFRKDRSHPTQITEYLAECKRNTQPWGSHPRRMLRHKALIQCARVAFGFAGIFDEDEAERIVKGKHMGDADEVPEPASTTAHSVRQLLQKVEVVPEVPPIEDNDPTPFAVLAARLASTTDAEIAALILDESRDLPDEDQATLSAQYRAKFQPD
jgi:hypothetical protein